jgi:hypothetical protein
VKLSRDGDVGDPLEALPSIAVQGVHQCPGEGDEEAPKRRSRPRAAGDRREVRDVEEVAGRDAVEERTQLAGAELFEAYRHDLRAVDAAGLSELDVAQWLQRLTEEKVHVDLDAIA